MPTENRRTFLNRAGMATACAAGSFLHLNALARGANEKIVLGLVGARAQGRGVALRAIQHGAGIKNVCDIDDAVLDKVGAEIEKAQSRKPETAKDFRRVLEDKDIDAVIIATPDHWHAHIALLACQAGKDVYVEKPLSHTIREGQLIRDAARKYKRVVQVGTQRRSRVHLQQAAEYVASGKLGKVCLVKAWMCQVRRSIGTPPDGAPPPGVDYETWLGPAPKRPFNPNRFHYNWRFFWDYGNTELGNQGVHMLDVALMGIQRLRGTDRCLPTRISGHGGIYWLDDAKEVPDTQTVTYDFGNLMVVWELRSFASHNPMEGTAAGTAFYGTDATLIADLDRWSVHGKDKSTGPAMKSSGGSHEKNFLDCIKSRNRPNGDVELGRMSTLLSHLGNIRQRLGRDIRFDPATETFPDDKAANALLSKEYRKGYALPKV